MLLLNQIFMMRVKMKRWQDFLIAMKKLIKQNLQPFSQNGWAKLKILLVIKLLHNKILMK